MGQDEKPTIEFVDDPVLLAAIQKQHKIDFEAAGPKASKPGFEYRGIYVESRWSVISELERMKRIVDQLPSEIAEKISTIWCDSKAEACYSVNVRSGEYSRDLKEAVSRAILSVSSGHNGVFFNEGDGLLKGDEAGFLEPEWLGDLEQWEEVEDAEIVDINPVDPNWEQRFEEIPYLSVPEAREVSTKVQENRLLIEVHANQLLAILRDNLDDTVGRNSRPEVDLDLQPGSNLHETVSRLAQTVEWLVEVSKVAEQHPQETEKRASLLSRATEEFVLHAARRAGDLAGVSAMTLVISLALALLSYAGVPTLEIGHFISAHLKAVGK